MPRYTNLTEFDSRQRAGSLYGYTMETKRTPMEWFEAAIEARGVAACLTDEEDRAAWERLADECDARARIALDNRR